MPMTNRGQAIIIIIIIINKQRWEDTTKPTWPVCSGPKLNSQQVKSRRKHEADNATKSIIRK